MTLRTRLALALVTLSTVGLAVFGVATYSLYEQSLENRLDEQLHSVSGPLSGRMVNEALGLSSGPTRPDRDSPDGANPQPGGGSALNVFGALVDSDGDVIATAEPLVTTSRPALGEDLHRVRNATLKTVGSTTGSGDWRVLVEPVEERTGGPGGFDSPLSSAEIDLAGAVAVVALPTDEIEAQMGNLLWIELVSALVLISALGAGAWLVLGRGLRPLESMASSAADIARGDLAVRVSPSDDRTEVGQLGIALNTMLDAISAAFDERDATEARLRQFLADASHELRTPLTSIQGFAELSRLDPRESEVDLPVILRRIEEESQRMKVLVEDLLLLARIDQTRPFEPEAIDLAVLAADACTDAVAVDPTRTITLDAPTPVVVRGDVAHLRQAIANLVTNALRHTDDGTPLEVAVVADAGHGTVRVRDHGLGLDSEGIEHAFDRFWQADAARSGSGAGLGLSIVAGIAEEHGGSARITNHPDGGAVAELSVALSDDVLSDPRSDEL